MKKILLVLSIFMLSSCTDTYTKEEVDLLIDEAIAEAMENNKQTYSVSDYEEQIINTVDEVIDSVFLVGTFDREGNYTSSGSGGLFYEDSEYYYGFTNAHVVENGSEFVIYFDQNTSYDAMYHAMSLETDLAVIKVSKEDLKEADLLEFAEYSDISLASQVIAIGSPNGYDYLNSVTSGVVSGLDRTGMVYDSNGDGFKDQSVKMIQHDATINHGNSGGPLFNTKGEVIGVNTLKVVANDAENMGFAISSDYASKVLHDLVEYKEYVTPKLGIYVLNQTVEATEDKSVGILVTEIIPGGVAEAAGMENEDIIVGFNDQEIINFNDLKEFLFLSRIGDTVTVTVLRGTEYIDLEVTFK